MKTATEKIEERKMIYDYEKLKLTEYFNKLIVEYGKDGLIDIITDYLIAQNINKDKYIYCRDSIVEDYFCEWIDGEQTVVEYLDDGTENHYQYRVDRYGYNVLMLTAKNYTNN